MIEEYKGLKLDDFQRDAIQGILDNKNVIVAAPTGAGKTLVAEYTIEKGIADERKIIYTSPIKALSNQKFRDFREVYGELIGIMTGDVTINPEAPVLIMTTEVFRNTIFEDSERLKDYHYAIFDEVHYMDDPERGTVWEESIIFAPDHMRFLALSATIANLREFCDWVQEVRSSDTLLVLEDHRPVPLEHYLLVDGETFVPRKHFGKYKKKFKKKKRRRKRGSKKRPSLQEINKTMIDNLVKRGHTPAIYFLFSRAACEILASRCQTRDLLEEEEKKEMSQFIEKAMADLSFSQEESQHARPIIRMLMNGVCYHHAGLLPILKELVERCFSTGLVKLLFATETFALGVNMPAKSVVFENLKKYNGVREVYVKTRDYQQMAGRAGRRGIDDRGYVYCSVVPGKDSHHRVQQVVSGQVERISSRFNLDYSTLLNLYERLGENFFDAWERSFATFRAKDYGKKPNWYKNMLTQVDAKLKVLKRTGYIENEKITAKGDFALRISGYEMQMTELYFNTVLSQLSPVQLNIMFSAMIFDGRSDYSGKRRFSLSSKLKKKAQYVLGVFSGVEKEEGIQEPINDLDFAMAFATELWSQGHSLTEIEQKVEFSAGDIVRNLRRIVNVMRTFEKALEKEEEGDIFLLDNLQEGIGLMKRDMVDAEAQLKRGLHTADKTAIAAALRKAGLIPKE